MTTEKQITVQWQPARANGFYSPGPWMKVVESNHPNYKVGSGFDFGFFNLATEQGYTIVSLPVAKKETVRKVVKPAKATKVPVTDRERFVDILTTLVGVKPRSSSMTCVTTKLNGG